MCNNGLAVIYAVRTSSEKFINSLRCVAKKEKSKRVPELGGRELTYLSPDVLTAFITADPLYRIFCRFFIYAPTVPSCQGLVTMGSRNFLVSYCLICT